MGADQGHIDPSADERFEAWPVGRLSEDVEAPVFQVRNAWREQETQESVSSISLFDGLPITEFDVLPASASRLL